MSNQPLFAGLSAFPLTPVKEDGIDELAFGNLIARLAAANVDSIGALGSTGSYVYLSESERARVARIAVEHAGRTPVIVGISALRTRDVLTNAERAQSAGVSAVMLSPVSYQKLTEDEVFGLFQTVCRSVSVPLIVYDNPGTTNFTFSDRLLGRIASLPRVASIKIPGVPPDQQAASQRLQALRHCIPPHVTLGISGDAVAVTGLIAGCDGWYSVIAGLFPRTALEITRASRSGQFEVAQQLSARLEPIWALFRRYGSLRVIAAAATLKGLITEPNLPLPLRHLDAAATREVADAMAQANLTD